MMALVMTSVGRPQVCGVYNRSSDGKRVLRTFDCSLTYDAVSRTYDVVAVKNSRKAITDEQMQRAYTENSIFLAHVDDGDDKMSPPFIGRV